MLKKVKILLILISLIGLGAIAYIFLTVPSRLVPYPYQVELKSYARSQEVQEAEVLIIGDRMGVALNNYLPEITTRTFKNLKNPLKIINWSEKHEGMHRTLARIKSLKKLPSLIIYHGASEEFYEKKYDINDIKIIFENLSKYDDEKLASFILTFSFLSKFIYKKQSLLKLNEIKKNQQELDSISKQKQIELGIKLFEIELNELVEYIIERGSKIILLTTPINLEVPPRKICGNATNKRARELLSFFQKKIEEGQSKTIFSQLEKFAQTTVGNSIAYYLLGLAAKDMGRISLAKKFLVKASIFDCETWRGNIIFNILIRRMAQNRGMVLIDFDSIVNKHLGVNELFLNDIFPQNLFYNQMIDEIIVNIIRFYNL